MTQPLDLDPIRQRHQAATGGHWHLNRGSVDFDPNFVFAEHHGYEHGIGSLDFGDGDQADADREFVLNAHTDMGQLIAEVERLCAELADARDRLNDVRVYCDRAERQALRWEHPLPVPEWAVEIRALLPCTAAYLAGRTAPQEQETAR